MKHNLKNRPKDTLWDQDERFHKWFEGFEQELRAKLKKLKTSEVFQDYNVTRAICELEDILGVES